MTAAKPVEPTEKFTVVQRFVKAWSEIKNPELDGENPHYGNKYSTLAAIMKVVREACVANGIVYRQRPMYDDGGRYMMSSWVFDGEGNTYDLSCSPLPESPDPQKSGSALTYAKRQQASVDWGIVGDTDDDGNAAAAEAEKAKAQQTKKPTATSQPTKPSPEKKPEPKDPFTDYRIALTKAMNEGRIKDYGDANKAIEDELKKERPNWNAADLRRACGIIAMMGRDQVEYMPDAPLAEEDIPF